MRIIDNKEKIPKIFHFVYGLKPQTTPFPLYHYLCLESCRKVNKPDKIYFYYKYLPHGTYWDLIKPHLTLQKVDLNDFISNFRYPLKHRFCSKYRYAHHSDFIRLEKLLKHGGVYADIDTIFVNPLPEKLFDHDFVIGREDDIIDQNSCQQKQSLCNAFMMAKPQSEFCRLYLEKMQDNFDGSWSSHSTLLPCKLAQQNPKIVHIEGTKSFYSFMWTKNDLNELFKKQYEGSWEGIYNIHMWAHLWASVKRLDFSNFHERLLNERFIRNADTTYNMLARKYLPKKTELPEKIREAKVSTIIPTRNRPEFLYDAVCSMLDQTLLPHEIIIIDDASNPEAAEANREIAALSPRIKYIYNKDCLGRSKSRNTALSMAAGDYIHFLDDDDLLHPEFCEKTIERMTSTSCDGVVTDCRLFHKFLPDYNLAAPLQLKFHKHLLEKDMELYLLTEPVAINSVILKSSVIKQFKFNEQINVGEDTLFFLEISRHNINWAGINRPLAFVRRHRSNTCRSSNYGVELKKVLHQLLQHSRIGEKNAAVTVHLQLLKNAFMSNLRIPLKSMIHILLSPLQTSLTAKRFLEREVALLSYRTTQRFKG